jgi:hypothetical protein
MRNFARSLSSKGNSVKKLLAGGTLAVLVFGGFVAGAAPASAHTPNVTADCGFVNVDLKYYQGADLTVVIDGAEVEGTTFDREFVKSYEISRDADHEWSIDVQAHDGDRYDYQQSGATTACETTPPAEVVPPATPETVAGCAASLDDVILPENTEAITYTKSEAGIVAALTSDAYAFPEDLGNYVLQEDGTALLPTEYIVIEEECAEPTPEPSAPSAAPSEEAVPPSAEPSASPSPEAEEPPVLAATGATVGGAIAFAVLLAAGGIALVWARKRMQNA